MLCNNFLNSKSWSILVRSGDQPIDVDQNEEEGSNADSQGGRVFGLSINNVIVILWPLDENSTVKNENLMCIFSSDRSSSISPEILQTHSSSKATFSYLEQSYMQYLLKAFQDIKYDIPVSNVKYTRFLEFQDNLT